MAQSVLDMVPLHLSEGEGEDANMVRRHAAGAGKVDDQNKDSGGNGQKDGGKEVLHFQFLMRDFCEKILLLKIGKILMHGCFKLFQRKNIQLSRSILAK